MIGSWRSLVINLKTLFGLNSFLSCSDPLLNLDLQLCVDNRELSDENIFVAIVGEKYNPLDFLDDAFKKGCRFVVYEKSTINDEKAYKFSKKLVLIEVSSILDFIQEAGAAVANAFRTRGGKIVAISGSNGKTTTKEMLTHILHSVTAENSVIATQKNNNNHLGVPFTLFQISKDTKYAVVELGSNHPGEISHLCKMLNPQYGVTTNIGETHLEFFKTKENVFKEEASLYEYSSKQFFINCDDQYLKNLALSKQTKSFGEAGKDYVFSLGERKALNGIEVKNAHILGKHNFTNLLVGMSIASEVTGRKLEELLQPASSFKPTFNRSQWISRDGQTIFLDAYNANPSSMKTAVREFIDHVTNSLGAKLSDICLVLGDMNELGSDELSYHESFGRELGNCKVGLSLFVGRFCEAYAKDYNGKSHNFVSVINAKDQIIRHMASHKYVFIKGSRSLQLETILDIK